MRTKERRRREANAAKRRAQADAPNRAQAIRDLISEQLEQQADRGVRRLRDTADIKRLRAALAALESPASAPATVAIAASEIDL